MYKNSPDREFQTFSVRVNLDSSRAEFSRVQLQFPRLNKRYGAGIRACSCLLKQNEAATTELSRAEEENADERTEIIPIARGSTHRRGDEIVSPLCSLSTEQ